MHKPRQLWFGFMALAIVVISACRTDENLSTTEGLEQTVVRTLAVPTNGLIGEWKLDGNVTDTKSGFATSLVNNPPFVASNLGQALNLTSNGTGGNGTKYVEVTQSGSATLDDLQEGSAYSISAWFNTDTTPSGTAPANFWMVVGKTNTQAIGIVYNPAGKFAARHYLTGNVLKLATATSTSSLHQWHHVAMVVTNVVGSAQGSLKLYVDGLLSQTETWPSGAGSQPKDFGTAKWRFGRSDADWSAYGKVDQIRMYNRALSASDVQSLHDETGGAADPTLRVGWMGMAGQVGKGPGDDFNDPIFHVVQWSPHAEGLGDVPGVLAQAQADDILIVSYNPGSPTNFGLNNNQFDSVAYRKQLDKIDTIPSFNTAVAAGRVFCYIGDEPNLPDWNNTWTPALFNYAAKLNKVRWHGCLTFGRVSPELLANGWGGAQPLTNYDKLDYAWLQYAAAYRKAGISIDSALKAQKAIAQGLNVGVALSMNMANAGYRVSLGDGVAACWDTDNNPNTATGVVIGSPAGSGFTEGQKVPCSQLGSVPVNQNLMASPAMVRRIADVGRDDPDVPFLLYWQYPNDEAGSDFLAPYLFRSDFTAAFEYAIAQGELRTNFNGYRQPKP